MVHNPQSTDIQLVYILSLGVAGQYYGKYLGLWQASEHPIRSLSGMLAIYESAHFDTDTYVPVAGFL